MASNNELQAVARLDHSKSHNPEIACQSRQAEITAKLARVPDRAYGSSWRVLKNIVDKGCEAGTTDPEAVQSALDTQ
eukprot:7002209-Ditylum_brightwellii.AAC.1